MRLSVAVAVTCLSIVGLSSAADVKAAIRKNVNIPAQGLGPALQTLAKNHGFQIVYVSDEVNSLRTQGASGELTSEEALEKLLSGTGLTFRYFGDNAVSIVAITAIPTSATRVSGATPFGASDPAQPESLFGKLRLALAQQAVQEDAGSSSSTGETEQRGGTLEEIVVTAQKREESIKDVPLTVSAVSGEDLVKRDIRDALSLSFAVPSLTVWELLPGQNLLAIRGISGERGQSSLIGVYLDEIPLTGGLRTGLSRALDVRTMDLERVEVLKGPQGTLFGEGAIGGVIRYVTTNPKLDRVEGRLSGTYSGTRDGEASQQLLGVVNVPLIDDVLGVRVAATYENNGGWLDNVGTGEEDFNSNEMKEVRAKVLFAPTPELSVSLLVDVHRLDADGSNIVNLQPYDRSDFRQAFDLDGRTDFHDHFEIYNLTATYDFGFATLLSSTSYADVENGGALTQYVPGVTFEVLAPDLFNTSTTTAQELRLTSNGSGPFKWLLGGAYKETKTFGGNTSGFDVLFPGLIVAELNAGRFGTARSEALTAFVDGSYALTDSLEVGGGVRTFRDEQEGASYFADGSLVGAPSQGDFEKTTYRAFIKYRLSDAVNLYLNTSSGFRSGGFNGSDTESRGGAPSYGPENSTFYEAGIKATLPGGTVGLELGLFKGEFDDQVQDVQVISPVDGNPLQYTINAGVAEIEGVEWLLTVSPINTLRFTLSGDVTDTKFTEVTPSAPANVGDPIDYVPEYNVTLATDYAFEWAASAPGFVNVSYSRKGKAKQINRRTGLGVQPFDESTPLDFLQASIGAQWNGYELTVFARNILDERDRLTPHYSGVWPQARPRTFGLSVGKSF